MSATTAPRELGALTILEVGGESSQVRDVLECGINYSGSEFAGGDSFGSGAGQTETVNCGNGIRSVFQNEQNIIEVTCNSGRQVR